MNRGAPREGHQLSQVVVSAALPLGKISVVLPAHGDCPFIVQAIESLRTESKWIREIIVVDDRMSSRTRTAVDRLAIFWAMLRIEPARGIGLVAALNTGVAVARGEFIGRMDADDVVVPGRFGKQLATLIGTPGCLVVGGQIQYITGAGAERGTSNYPTKCSAVSRALSGWCAVAHPTALINKTAFEKVGGYRELFVDSSTGACLAEDYDLWLRIRRLGSIGNVEDIVLQYRQHETQISTMNAATARVATLGVQIVDCLDQEGRQDDVVYPIVLHPSDHFPMPADVWSGSKSCTRIVLKYRAQTLIHEVVKMPIRGGSVSLLRECVEHPEIAIPVFTESLRTLGKRMFRSWGKVFSKR